MYMYNIDIITNFKEKPNKDKLHLCYRNIEKAVSQIVLTKLR